MASVVDIRDGYYGKVKYNKDGEEIDIEINGRHDPIIVPRAVVVVESMAAITILDALFENMKSKLSDVVDFYS